MNRYLCKCGRAVNKSTNADNTGNRETEGCEGCPYLMPWGPTEWDHTRHAMVTDVKGYAVYCDSAEQVLKNSLRSALLRTRFSWLADRIYNSKKIEINDRIRLTSILMGGGRFWYMPEAGTLRDALASAMWSGKHPGMDERLDDGTTDIDTLDAFEYTIERDYKRYLRLTE